MQVNSLKNGFTHALSFLKKLSQFNYGKQNLVRGFTLIEILVSLSIVTVLSAVVILNYTSSQDRLTIASMGQELAVTIRQAQTYGLAVRSQSSGQFGYGYGVYVNPTTYPNDYYVFVDINANGVFDILGSACNVSPECIQRLSFRNGVTATGVCSGTTCYSSGTRRINILFLRPSTSASLSVTGGGSTTTPGKGSIILTSPRGRTITVTVENTGQILVQ